MYLLVFPNQLFEHHPALSFDPEKIILIEDSLFFGDHFYPAEFHQQKLWLLRTAMKRYELRLQSRGFVTRYIDHDEQSDSLYRTMHHVADDNSQGSTKWLTLEPVDFVLRKRLEKNAAALSQEIEFLPNPGFINQDEINREYRAGKKRWFMAEFYQWQRQRLDLLMVGDKPSGGRWSFDVENRKKIPKQLLKEIPRLPELSLDEIDEANRAYVQKRYPDNPGNIEQLIYPTSHQGSLNWLREFLANRFAQFGDYEDAIEEGEDSLWHSVLTPMLNIGLLTPNQVVDETLRFAESVDIPLNCVEGFIRQVVGWREFVRATYTDIGVPMRNANQWDHVRSLPKCFYEGNTGVDPIDDCIQRVVSTGYCHHIERLMVLGGFLFLCEIKPDDIYQWFMEMFVDSYDWVMVPNVYGMSQHTGGETITSKPYFSGSSYIRKMSHYPKGEWCATWDGLYWRWIWLHRNELGQNPRWSMMCRMVEKMDASKRNAHLQNAEQFLSKLDG